MHDFLAITENQKRRSQNNRVIIAGKLLAKKDLTVLEFSSWAERVSLKSTSHYRR